MTPTRRQLLLGSALGLTGLAGCSQPPTESTKTAYTIGLTYIPNVQFSPFYYGVTKQLFGELDITLRHHGQQEGLFTALLAGEEDVVFASSDEAMVAAAGGEKLQTFATAYQRFPVVILASKASGIASVGDLKGRTLGVAGRFGSTWYATLAALASAGLTESDVKITDIGYTQVSALTTGRVDAVVGYLNNEAVQLEAAGFGFTTLEVTPPEAPALVGPGLIAVADRVPTAHLKVIAEGMRAAEEAIAGSPQLGIDAALAEVPTLSEPAQRSAAEAVLTATIGMWQRTSQVSVAVDPEAFSRMCDFLVAAGIIKEVPAAPFVVL